MSVVSSHTSLELNEIQQAALEGDYEEVTRLQQDPDTTGVDEAIQIAAQHGFTKIVEYLMARADPAVLDNRAIRLASAKGYCDIVHLLLKDERVDPSAMDNWAIRAATYNGHLPVVTRLLQDPRVDPTADDSYAIRWAFARGHLPVMRRLLQDARVVAAVDEERLSVYRARVA